MSESPGQLTLLYDADVIDARVRELAAQINARYAGEPVVVVGVLKGAFIFCADLIRRLVMPLEVDFVRLASYGQSSTSAGEIKFTKDMETSLVGKHVLIVEDIIDTGRSMDFLCRQLENRQAVSVSIAAFVDKPCRREVPVKADFVGFCIADGFIVGYGLDYAERYRELPGIYELRLNNADAGL